MTKKENLLRAAAAILVAAPVIVPTAVLVAAFVKKLESHRQ